MMTGIVLSVMYLHLIYIITCKNVSRANGPMNTTSEKGGFDKTKCKASYTTVDGRVETFYFKVSCVHTSEGLL